MNKKYSCYLFLVFSGVAYAQTDSLQEIHKNEDVVITASRKAENKTKIPLSIQIVTTKKVEEQLQINPNINNVLQNTVSGLSYNTGRTSNTGQTLRGRQVLVLIDGIPQSTPLRNGGRDIRTIDPNIIERIEVLKGSTSIYGNGADGGIINYITKKPSNKPISGSFSTGFSMGNTGNISETIGHRSSAMINGKINKFSYLLSGMYAISGLNRDADGLALSPTYSLSRLEDISGALKLGYDFSPNTNIEFSYNYFSSKSKLQYAQVLGVYLQNPTYGEKTDAEIKGDAEGTPYNHNFYLKFNQKKLFLNSNMEFIAYKQAFKTVYGYDVQFFENGGQSNIESDKYGLRLNLNTPFEIKSFLKGDFLYGADWLNDNTAQKLQDGRFWTPDMTMKNLAPYAQLNLDLWQKINIKTGVRWENINVDVDDFTTVKTWDGSKYIGGVEVKGGELNYKAFTKNAGIKINYLTYFAPYINYSQAFSINELGRILRTSQVSIIDKLPTDPIIVDTYEVGASGRWKHYFNYNLSLYKSLSELGASYKQEGSGMFTVVRAPEKIWGYEVEIGIIPCKWLEVNASYSVVKGDSNLSEGEYEYETPLGSDRIMAPKTLVSVAIQPTDKLRIQLQSMFVGNRDEFQPNAKTGLYSYGQGPVKSYEIVNASINYQINNNWSVNLSGENILNEDYYPAISQFSARNADYIKGSGMRTVFTLNYKF